ncbi:MAG: bifunctional DNA-formamidopyrimidine glycosylase/DNA-(apurinic or apyrimidinic site) lyase [Dermatophilaceae bacterium]
MPELPEVEVVRRGLAAHVTGRTVSGVELSGSRVARRHVPGPEDLVARLTGQVLGEAHRRGKYLWIPLAAPDAADELPAEGLVVHLGMSGQLLVRPPGAPDERHLHARFDFADGGPQLRFVDQRTFGGLSLDRLDGRGIPAPVRHIAPDPFDPAYDRPTAVERLKARHSAVKRGLLDQRVVSGIGNIYADEALWRAGVHGERDSSTLTRPVLGRLLDHVRDVLAAALAAGGTSFDRLYVDVNGASGYFSRSLAAYGQAGMPCRRCGTPIRREAFMNRSSYSCPRCQPRPRRAAR